MQAYNDGDHETIAILLEALRNWNRASTMLPRVLYVGGEGKAWVVRQVDRESRSDADQSSGGKS